MSAAGDNCRLHGLLVEFESADALLAGARRVRDAGYTRWDAHAPFAVTGLRDAVGIRSSRLAWAALVFGLLGVSGGMVLQWWTNTVDYPYLVSGKPMWSWPAHVPIAFALGILSAALAAGVGMVWRNGLPMLSHALLADALFRRASADRFFICIESGDPVFEEAITRELLASLGGAGVSRVDAIERAPLPRWLRVTATIVVVLAFVPPAWVVWARTHDAVQPRIHVISDMDHQPPLRPQSTSGVFEDGRAARATVAGTIARGDAPPDEHFHTGKIDGEWADALPIPITEDLGDRARSRYKIYCSPCHGIDGDGRGAVAIRAEELEELDWAAPKVLYDPEIRAQPMGQLFHTITEGKGKMVGFGDLITPEDRWGIVLHLRVLQNSRQKEKKN